MVRPHLRKAITLAAVLIIFTFRSNAEVLEKGILPKFEVSDEVATLYIYRKWKFTNGGLSFGIYINDKFAGKSKNGSVLKVKVDSGVNDLWAILGDIKNLNLFSHKELILDGRNNYFIELTTSMSETKLNLIDEKTGKKNILSILN